MAIADGYAKAAWNDGSLLATWTPDRRLAVGDVITHARGGAVVVERKLADLVVDEELPRITMTDAARRTVLQSGVTFDAAVEGRAPVGTARIALGGSRSFLFVGGRARLHSFETVAGLRRQMTVMSALGRWEQDWQLVTAVRRHHAGTAVIAESDHVQAEIRVEGTGVVASLAEIEAGGHVSVTSGRAVTYTMGSCTPFYEALRIRRRWSGSRIDPVTLGEDESLPTGPRGEDIDVVRVTVDDVGLLD